MKLSQAFFTCKLFPSNFVFCTYVCSCVYVCVHVCPCVYVCVHVCACVSLRVHVGVHILVKTDPRSLARNYFFMYVQLRNDFVYL